MILQRWDVYPNLFEEEKKKAESVGMDEELEKFKARRRAFAGRWNRRFREGNDESGSAHDTSDFKGTD